MAAVDSFERLVRVLDEAGRGETSRPAAAIAVDDSTDFVLP